VPPEIRETAPPNPEKGNLVAISFEDMVKGSISMRGRKQIRQCCVTVNGASRLVTSGDRVDQKTYRALLEAGAVRPVQASDTVPEQDETPLAG
jgi:hypothetical protein